MVLFFRITKIIDNFNTYGPVWHEESEQILLRIRRITSKRISRETFHLRIDSHFVHPFSKRPETSFTVILEMVGDCIFFSS
jgi:hypothetical protein